MKPNFFSSIDKLSSLIFPLLQNPKNKLVLLLKTGQTVLITGNLANILSEIDIPEVETRILRDWLLGFYKGNRDDIGSLLMLVKQFFTKVIFL